MPSRTLAQLRLECNSNLVYGAQGGLSRLDVGSGGAVVSFLKKGGKEYVALLNKELHGTLTLTVGFDDARKVLEVRKDGQDRPVSGPEFTIAPGDLLVFQVSP